MIQLGAVATRLLSPESLVTVPEHPAYADSPAAAIRKGIQSGNAFALADASKCAREIYKIAQDENVRLRVPLGLDSLKLIKIDAEEELLDVKAGEHWSADLQP